MGTDFQEVYDAYESKLNENLIGKESLIFQFMKSAISKSYKSVIHSLEYVVLDKTLYTGNFNDTLNQDEIELISLWMVYETKRRRKEYLESIRSSIGTKDFSQLPDKVKEFNAIGISMKDLKQEIDDLKNEFNTYNY